MARKHQQSERRGVVFPDGETGSSLLRRILGEAAERFPRALAGALRPEDAKAFRSRYGAAVTRFEAARLAADDRVEVACFLVERARDAVSIVDQGGDRSLTDALAEPGAPLPIESIPLSGKARLIPRVPYRGRTWTGSELRELVALLRDEARISDPVVTAIDWLLDHAVNAAGEIDLEGRRVAVIGAAAELAPTPLLLEAGAEVLWIDTVDPPESLAKDSTLSGRVSAPASPTDLLEGPSAIAATLRAFAEEGPVDVGLYAYAPGRGREWRLTESMNAIVDSLPDGALRSVGLLISPTTPASVRPETLAAADQRHRDRPLWQRGLEAAGLLGRGAWEGEGDARVFRNVVSVQGVGYQAAQYVGKTLAVERWASCGPTGQAGPVPVSANVAAITMTRSLSHPVFEAAFAGATAFGVETFEPGTTRALNGLLFIHDLLNPAAPGALGGSADSFERAQRLHDQQVHGGLFALPYALEPTIQVGAVIGLGRRPGLIPPFVRGLVGR
jgi:hypothetical protein